MYLILWYYFMILCNKNNLLILTYNLLILNEKLLIKKE